MPQISILAPTFNHEKYIGRFIESTLNQGFNDFEVLIVDDCSSDNTTKEILKYKDKRIKLIKHDFNRGVNAALNAAFKRSKSDILLFCAGDDSFELDALEMVYNAHQKNDYAALYTPLIPVDENNNVIEELMDGYVNMQNRSKSEFIYYTFLMWNCLTSPGMSMKRQYAKVIFPLPASMVNFQDYQMHIRLMKLGEIGVLDKRIVRYKVPMQNGSQLSSPSQITGMREMLETHALLDEFLTYDDIPLLEATFAKEIAQTGVKPYVDTLPFFWGAMALCSQHQIRKIWGYHKIMQFYNQKGAQEILHKRYAFTFANLLHLAQFCVAQGG
ncbi:glycosyltransferase family 2 protein [Helicobacter sp.]|uniref:glycosyltransferase family 2 protein n=1 Tax=Helicobacter sp. TaxID=218 RepID=UPI0025BE5634|nr:glycosyltransferase [Helicobacter sp.]MDY2584406.1 glycosyltransferase [Helicobacter sp.]